MANYVVYDMRTTASPEGSTRDLRIVQNTREEGKKRKKHKVMGNQQVLNALQLVLIG